MKKIIIINLLFILTLLALAEEGSRVKLSGFVMDKEGNPLPNATILINSSKTGSISNNNGFYVLSLFPGTYQIEFSYIGFKTEQRTVVLSGNEKLNVYLEPNIESLDEVIVKARRPEENIKSNKMGVAQLPIETIQKIPALFGEIDVIKAIMLLPGVSQTSEGSSGFSVRGGSPDQNLILYDKAMLYNPSHFLGFFSVFNNDVINDVQLYKSNIPASYGGRLSSMLDITSKTGNLNEFAARGGIGTISSRLTIEGPIVQNQSSFLLGARRTYADIFLPLSKDENIKDSKLHFYDLNLKLTQVINEKNRLFLSAYSGSDVFKNQFATINFGNNTLSTRWNHIGKKLNFDLSAVLSNYNYFLESPEGDARGFEWISNSTKFGLINEFELNFNENHSSEFGFSSSYSIFNPGITRGNGEQSLFTEFILPKDYFYENAAYLLFNHNFNDKLKINYGIRFSNLINVGEETVYTYDENYRIIDSSFYEKGQVYNTYYIPEPRFSLTYIINDISSIKMSYARTSQFMHLASNSSAGTPIDIWFPSNNFIKPQIADQYSIGFFRNFYSNAIETSVELYYKDMINTIDFKDHAQLFLNQYIEKELRIGSAYSYGAEFLAKFFFEKLNGWVSYTYSKTLRNIPELNQGKDFPSPWDKPHDISVILNYEFRPRLTFSSNWVFSSGAPVTFPVGRMEINGAVLPVYSERNSYRYPPYHRLDLSVTYKNKKRSKFQSEWNFSIYNAYARKNVWTINFVQDRDDPSKTYAEKTFLFSIIPAITFNFKFN